MRKIEGYQCDNCSTLYVSEELAVSCENKHAKRKEDAKIIGMSFENQSGKYGMSLDAAQNVPKSVTVKFSENHGDFGRYVLEHYGYRGV